MKLRRLAILGLGLFGLCAEPATAQFRAIEPVRIEPIRIDPFPLAPPIQISTPPIYLPPPGIYIDPLNRSDPAYVQSSGSSPPVYTPVSVHRPAPSVGGSPPPPPKPVVPAYPTGDDEDQKHRERERQQAEQSTMVGRGLDWLCDCE